MKIALASGFHFRHVAIHHHILGARSFYEIKASGAVIPVTVTDQKDFDVAELESQFFHTCLDKGHGVFQPAVDEDVDLRGGDEKAGKSLGSHIINIANYMIRRKRFAPLGTVWSEQGSRRHGAR